eukprot:CAMPEP_0180547232 /NCGR_PEP_ID=MMETSP1036_2-20121128/70980_1 /TAXON_ID=632150 /ORGANISM="Azadinium spinosum, Strain 3D9" /LENGTH=63 /DNA_ID=CAMNT_0022562361 /DNA_START=31 /DNA_END=222 /DNA_ORIENTATION=+
MTLYPSWASTDAHVRPPIPEPTMITSQSFSFAAFSENRNFAQVFDRFLGGSQPQLGCRKGTPK